MFTARYGLISYIKQFTPRLLKVNTKEVSFEFKRHVSNNFVCRSGVFFNLISFIFLLLGQGALLIYTCI